MTDERTIGELTPVVTLLPAALIEIEQGVASFSATIQQALDLIIVANVGAGDVIFRDETPANTFNLKSLIGGTGITLVAGADAITINAAAAAGLVSINADTTAAQILAGTAARISLVDAGATHTFDIDSAYVGQTSLTTLGTITTGVWNGTAITGANINAALADLSDVTAKTGSGTIVVMDTSPTIVTPTIASFINSTHSHLNAAGGGQITEASISDLQAYWLDATTNTGTNKTFNSFTNDISADEVHVEVRNESGGTINKGDAVFVSGYSVGQDLPLVQLADSSGAATMPAFGIVESTSIANNTNGDILISGRIMGFNTSSFSAGDVLYISNTGTTGNTLTNVKPTGTDLIEAIGEVLRSHATLGTLEVETSGVVNDLPNVAVHDLSMGGNNLTNVVIVTPTIASFVNATHDHSNAAGGGNLTNTALTSGVFAAITGLGAQSQALVMGTNLITGILGTQFVQNTITYNATQVFDLDSNEKNQITLTGVLSTLTTSNRGAGKSKQIFIIGDSVDRVLTFNTSWKTNPSDATVTVTANTFGVLSLYCRGTAETDVFAVYVEFS